MLITFRASAFYDIFVTTPIERSIAFLPSASFLPQ
jgi:hypothetical protein